MGWLGWTERDALRTDVNSILVAMEGKLEMLYPAIKEKASKKRNFNGAFKDFIKTHNANFTGG